MAASDRDPPLVSPRSPSYARARQELLHPSLPADAELVALFARLSEAEENAGKACSTAAATLTDPALAAQARSDAAIHGARRAALAELIEAAGGSAPRPDECRDILLRAADVASAGSDAAVMAALKAVRDELSAAYDEARSSPILDARQSDALAHLAPSPPGSASEA